MMLSVINVPSIYKDSFGVDAALNLITYLVSSFLSLARPPSPRLFLYIEYPGYKLFKMPKATRLLGYI
jgi:hypothetical protein